VVASSGEGKCSRNTCGGLEHADTHRDSTVVRFVAVAFPSVDGGAHATIDWPDDRDPLNDIVGLAL
jgi:hypothetical protein